MAADTTYQSKVYRKNGGEELVVADGGIIRIESGGSLIPESGAVLTLPDISLEVGDLALATGSLIIGVAGKATALDAKGDGKILIGNGTTAAMQSLGTDVTMTNTGAVTIANNAITAAKINADAVTTAKILDGNVTNAKLAAGAGVGALLTAGLGGSISVTKTSAATDTIVAAHGTKDRAVIVLVIVDETYDIGTGTLPTVKIGEDDTIEKAMAATVLDTEAAGTVLAFAFTNTATKKIIATTTAAVGNATGGCSIVVLAIPTT
jgi:hypothetical protein